ncbi:MAG TPA: heavy metal-binding domain-containing protein [Acidobacteriaceae bacterium]|nr:heavy metal-binding domain-containing protein [Acidobacteriaceae bacterium]
MNITNSRSQIAQKMIATAETIAGYSVIKTFGPVEAVIEKGFSKAAIHGIGVVDGGGLSDMVFDAKQEIALAAHDLGANAVICFRYSIAGRELEKSLIAYGTAVHVEQISLSETN